MLCQAANLGHTSVVKKLIKHDADINAGNRQSNTALHFAYEKLHYDIIRQLEAHGAAPSHDIVNAAGHTPRKYMYAKVPLDRKLKIACQFGDLRNAEFFLLQARAHILDISIQCMTYIYDVGMNKYLPASFLETCQAF